MLKKENYVEKVVGAHFPGVILLIMIIYFLRVNDWSYIKLFSLVKESGCKGDDY